MSMDIPSAEQVAAFLRRHSEFLLQYPDLALTLRLPTQVGANTASLAGYQLENLRESNRLLVSRMGGLIQTAQSNELLVQRIHMLGLRLLKSNSLIDALQQVAASLREDFHTDLISICVIDLPSVPLQASWLQQVPANAPGLVVFQEHLRSNQPVCGRLKAEKLQFLFREREAEVASAVLLPLDPIGLLAVGSGDANRFHPGMGTVFLSMIAELIRTALAVQVDRKA